MSTVQTRLQWTAERSERASGIADKVLAALLTGPKSKTQLEVYGPRVAAYIHQLKKRGHSIGADWQDGQYVYAYRGRLNVEVLDAWKAAYYESFHWQACRRDRLIFDRFACTLCGASNTELQVHHWCYELFAEKRDDLQTLCDKCHQRIHDNANVTIHFPHYVTPAIAERLIGLMS